MGGREVAMDEKRVLKQWHLIFGAFLARRYEPAQIQVEVEVPTAIFPPVLDILLLRREHLSAWNAEQRAVLPDGIRDTQANRIVIEFKYSESLDVGAVRQTLIYDELYCKSKSLEPEQVSTFLVCSKSPSRRTVAHLGFVAGSHPGLYRNCSSVAERVNLIVLNELSTEPHNLAFKLFASKRAIRRSAFEQLNQNLQGVPEEAIWFANMLDTHGLSKGEANMLTEMTEAQIIEMGRRLGKAALRRQPIKDRLEGIPAQKLLEFIPKQVRLEGIPTQERLEGIPTQERLEGIPTQERLEGIPTQEVLDAINPEELVKYLQHLPGEKLKLIRLNIEPSAS
jgi:hypothetical protein